MDLRNSNVRTNMTIYDEIEARRAEQIAKGYDATHDDEHDNGEIAMAAAAYAAAGAKKSPAGAALWPWSIDQFHPTDARINLIDAAALCVAEIERLDRAATP